MGKIINKLFDNFFFYDVDDGILCAAEKQDDGDYIVFLYDADGEKIIERYEEDAVKRYITTEQWVTISVVIEFEEDD